MLSSRIKRSINSPDEMDELLEEHPLNEEMISDNIRRDEKNGYYYFNYQVKSSK